MFLDSGSDGFKFEFVHVLFSSFFLAILYFVWKSTSVREIPMIAAPPIGNFVRRSSSMVSNVSTSGSTSEENLNSSVENITESIFVEATETFNQSQQRHQQDEVDEPRSSEVELSEEEQIIRDMDRDLPSSSTSSCVGSTENVLRLRTTASTSNETDSSDFGQHKEEEKISIKLKYLNDEIKTVQGFLSETIGNFKRRQFNAELQTSKLIKLIFNGQILEDDKKSLSQCGLFSEAVVHCLILQKRQPISPDLSNHHVPQPRSSNVGMNNNLFIYIIGMVLVSLTLVFCWYCRITYSSYFSWYSTVGLILMTSLFIVMIPLLTLIER